MQVAATIMSESLLSFEASITVQEAISQLVDHGYSAAPVVRDGKVVGIVTELELFDVLFDPQLRKQKVEDFMTTKVVSVNEDTPLSEVAHLFALHGIRRVPVVREGVPVGVVSRRDLLRYAVQCEEPMVLPLTELMVSCNEL